MCGLSSDEDATIAQEEVKELKGQVIGGIIYMNPTLGTGWRKLFCLVENFPVLAVNVLSRVVQMYRRRRTGLETAAKSKEDM